MEYFSFSELREAYKRKENQFRLFKEVVDLLANSEGGTRALDEVMEKIRESAKVRSVNLMKVDSLREILTIVASGGIAESDAKKVSFRVGEGIAGVVAKIGEALLVRDVRKNPHFKDTGHPISSLLSVPVFDRDRVVGVLNLTDKADGFSDEDTEVFATIAKLLGVFLRESEKRRVRPYF